MSEESLREIIGIAKKSKWNQIRKFVKFIIRSTLKRSANYSLTALDVSLNGKKELKYDRVIKNKEQIKEIDKIVDFNHLSLYQATPTANNHINLSQNNGTIIVLAKYWGPSFNQLQTFDFSVNLDAIDDPFFTIGNGKKINCSEILKIISNGTNSLPKTRKEQPKKQIVEKKDTEINDIEAYVFEKLTNKNAIWKGEETKTFHNWKAKTNNKYRVDTGKISYYKGKPTKQYSTYLKSLISSKKIKAEKPNKQINKKPATPKPKPKNNKEELTEPYLFKKITGKNAIWNGSETQNFIKWKKRTHSQYQKDTGKNPYYNQKLTKNFKDYLVTRFKF
ncbi:MAG: hypothetical protein ACFE9S_19510 [Candidatus Hermodarchaeota archaeon]